jgi:hypothetical protein
VLFFLKLITSVRGARKRDYATECGRESKRNRKKKASQLNASLIGQQKVINKRSIRSESSVCVKCVVAEIIPKEELRVFKALLLSLAEMACPDKKRVLKTLASRAEVVRGAYRKWQQIWAKSRDVLQSGTVPSWLHSVNEGFTTCCSSASMKAGK